MCVSVCTHTERERERERERVLIAFLCVLIMNFELLSRKDVAEADPLKFELDAFD